MGGFPVLGYGLEGSRTRLIVNETEAEQVREIFGIFQPAAGVDCHAGSDPTAGMLSEELDDAPRRTAGAADGVRYRGKP